MTDLPAISLFSGVGGLDLGAHRAGFRIRAAVELDRDSAASLRANQFRERPDAVLERSIVGLATVEILERAGLAVGEAALVIGGRPALRSRDRATGSSTSGRARTPELRCCKDPGASLLDEFAGVVVEARPAAELMENVWGLAYNNHNTVPLGPLVGQLEGAGYKLRRRASPSPAGCPRSGDASEAGRGSTTS